MANERPSLGQELLNVPMGDMIRDMAFAIADAQVKLDNASMAVAAMMSGHELVVAAEGKPAEAGKDLGEGYKDIGGKVYRDTRVYFGFRDELTSSGTVGKATITFTLASGVTEVLLTPKDLFTCDGVKWRPAADKTIKGTATGIEVFQEAPTTQAVATVTNTASWKKDSTLTTLTISSVASNTTGVSPAITRTPNLVSMLELGFTPTFYQFVDTIIEVKIAIKITSDSTDTTESRVTSSETARQTDRAVKASPFSFSAARHTGKVTTVQTSQVDAKYTQTYGYSAEGSSLLRTKLVPVPPPAVLEERIRAMTEANRANPKTSEEET